MICTYVEVHGHVPSMHHQGNLSGMAEAPNYDDRVARVSSLGSRLWGVCGRPAGGLA